MPTRDIPHNYHPLLLFKYCTNLLTVFVRAYSKLLNIFAAVHDYCTCTKVSAQLHSRSIHSTVTQSIVFYRYNKLPNCILLSHHVVLQSSTINAVMWCSADYYFIVYCLCMFAMSQGVLL